VKKFDTSAKYKKEVPEVMQPQPCCSPDDVMLPHPSKRTPEHFIGVSPDDFRFVPQPCYSPDDVILPHPSKRTPEHLIGVSPDDFCFVPKNSPWDVSELGPQKLDSSSRNLTREPTPEEKLPTWTVSPK
jgi:hypothetical protein